MSEDYYTELGKRRGGYISAPDGWLELVKECDELLAHLDPDYRIIQIKEKFGGLRYYFATDKTGLDEKVMRTLVQAFEERSGRVCQECGGLNGLGESVEIRGWYFTLCPVHTKAEIERKYNFLSDD
jgi:hypothetical protein